jgi:hypothetical protein
MGDPCYPGWPYGGQNQLAIAPYVSGADLVVLNKGSAQRYRVASVDSIAQYILGNGVNTPFSQYFAPNATGFTVTLGPTNQQTTPTYPYPPYPPYPTPSMPQWTQDFWALVSPIEAYAAGTIVLPPNTYIRDKQKVFLFFTQAVTTLSFTLNGAAAGFGLPTTVARNGYFTLQYDLQTNSWYRVG